jgi:hypothetical protein
MTDMSLTKDSRIIGQDALLSALEGLQHKLPKAILLYGEEGLGKSFIASQYALFLSQTDDVDKNKRLINLFNDNTHPDIHLLDGTGGSVKVQEIRDWLLKINNPLFENPLKIFLFFDIQNIATQNGWDALLKRIEDEYEDATLFMFTSTSLDIPKTFLTRTHTMKVTPYTTKDLCTILCVDEIPLPFLSQGSLKRAKRLLGEVSVVNLYKGVFTLLKHISNLPEHKILSFCQKIKKDDMELVADIIASFVTSFLLEKEGFQDLLAQSEDFVIRSLPFQNKESQVLDLLSNLKKVLAVDSLSHSHHFQNFFLLLKEALDA